MANPPPSAYGSICHDDESEEYMKLMDHEEAGVAVAVLAASGSSHHQREGQTFLQKYGEKGLQKYGEKGLKAGFFFFLIKVLIGSFLVVYFTDLWGGGETETSSLQATAKVKQSLGREQLTAASLALRRIRESEGATFTEDALSDQITALPGLLSTPNFLQFSGYLDVSETKHNFYWYVESENDPLTDPLIFWTNGGPGCSGFIGFMGELGPFRPQHGLTLEENILAWNKIANMVFIEQPCGVGFSYSDDPENDYRADDSTAAEDNLQLLLQFLERYQHLAANTVYLAAESYGGHYLPTWARRIVEHNAAARNGTSGDLQEVNFGGFLVGNPYTDPLENMKGMVGTYWGHQLVPEYMHREWQDNGCSDSLDAMKTPECSSLSYQMFELVDDLDPYALDYKVCTGPSSTSEESLERIGQAQRDALTAFIHEGQFKSKHSARKDGNNNNNNNGNGKNSDNGKQQQKQELNGQDQPEEKNDTPLLESLDSAPEGLTYDACTDDYITKYLNQDIVKEAIHANTDIEWSECSRDLKYDRANSMNVPMEPNYQFLLNSGEDLKIMVYSGDDDSVCGTIGTQSWIWALGLQVTSKWQPWKYADQVAGYEVRFAGGFRFATVHGAGHEVPAFRPGPALKLLAAYLADAELDDARRAAQAARAAAAADGGGGFGALGADWGALAAAKAAAAGGGGAPFVAAGWGAAGAAAGAAARDRAGLAEAQAVLAEGRAAAAAAAARRRLAR